MGGQCERVGQEFHLPLARQSAAIAVHGGTSTAAPVDQGSHHPQGRRQEGAAVQVQDERLRRRNGRPQGKGERGAEGSARQGKARKEGPPKKEEKQKRKVIIPKKKEKP